MLPTYGEERARQRWLQSKPASLKLVNPPETARRYSDADDSARQTAGAVLSVLGSKGEWKVVSGDKSRWLSMDLGSVRCVHAIVVQCGALDRSFSGWVTKLKVHHSMDAAPPPTPEAWTELERDVATSCTSDPAREHRLDFREPQWMRHIKLTPQAWKVAGVLSTGENLEPFISMRAAVLATHHRAEDAADVAEMDPGAGAGETLITQRVAHFRAASAGASLTLFFNLRRGFSSAAAPWRHAASISLPPLDLSQLDEWAPAEVRLLRLGCEPALPMALPASTSSLVATLLPSCCRGDCVLFQAAGPGAPPTVGVVVERERASAHCVVHYVARQSSAQPSGAPLSGDECSPSQPAAVSLPVRVRPQRIVGTFHWPSGAFHMVSEAFDPPGAWAADLLRPLAPPSRQRPPRDLRDHLECGDTWLPADEYVSWVDDAPAASDAPAAPAPSAAHAAPTGQGGSESCCALLGSPPSARVYLSPAPEALAYGGVRGTRVALPSAHMHEAATGTVVSVCPAHGRMIVAVDNAHSPREFRLWAAGALGRQSRAWMRSLPFARLAALPADMTQASHFRYSPGVQLMVMRRGAFVDSTVVAWLGAPHGNRHVLTLDGLDERVVIDLNDVNHATQRCGDMRTLCELRRRYIEYTIADGREVEDAITGKRLLIEKQVRARMDCSPQDSSGPAQPHPPHVTDGRISTTVCPAPQHCDGHWRRCRPSDGRRGEALGSGRALLEHLRRAAARRSRARQRKRRARDSWLRQQRPRADGALQRPTTSALHLRAQRGRHPVWGY